MENEKIISEYLKKCNYNIVWKKDIQGKAEAKLKKELVTEDFIEIIESSEGEFVRFISLLIPGGKLLLKELLVLV